MRTIRLVLLASLFSLGAIAAPPEASDDAAAFGARETVTSVSLSADGKKLVYVGAGTEASTVAVVVDLVSGTATQVARSDGHPINITHCEFSAADRIVCQLYGLERPQGYILPIVRTLAMDTDGKKQIFLGQKDTLEQVGKRLGDGGVVDWMNGVDGTVLMARSYVPESTTGRLMGRTETGLGVDRIDTRTGKSTQVERPGDDASNFISDGRGNIRIMSTIGVAESTGAMTGVETYSYRVGNDRAWRKLSDFTIDRQYGDRGTGLIPVAVDPNIDSAYVLGPLDGRTALFRVKLDQSLKQELVVASKQVDVDNVVTIGRSGRVIGATYATERRLVEYFDPDYKALHGMLSKALPKQPLIYFTSASADEQTLVVHASSDTDPGVWYVFYRDKKALSPVSAMRPALRSKTLSPVKAITYPAADGTQIPGYLTLPPGVTEAKGLPAIVMPHGGPTARDEWGFDWLAQFFAQRGFVVLQPNYRGSSGYGTEWLAKNGFQGWRTSIGDVCDAGRWLVSQGMADASKLAVVGWSYGGYAALQSNVLDPDLFKAAIAVAPVTDLALLKRGGMMWSSGFIRADFIGSGPHITEGSPAENARAFKAPVLMFHGDTDLNVDLTQSRVMDKALRGAGKSTELIIYPKLEHSLRDSTARADMLRRSDEFLRKNLKL